MIFILHAHIRMEQSTSLGASGAFLARSWPTKVERWTWGYHQGSVQNVGKLLASSPTSYPSEREARSAVAEARKAFTAARMAKVVNFKDIPSDD